MPRPRHSTWSPPPCCPARSATCYPESSLLQREKALRVPCSNCRQGGVVQLRIPQGLQRMGITEGKGGGGADDHLALAETLYQESDGGRVEPQDSGEKEPGGDVGRLGQRL